MPAVSALTKPAPPPSDTALLERVAAGDRTALDDLFHRYRAVAFRVAYRLLGREADALDAVQDAFVKLLANLDRFRGHSSFKTWLLRIVSNAALDVGRQRKRDARVPQEPRDAQPERFGPDDAPPPDAGLDRADLRAKIDAALARLPDTQRQTFVLHVEGGLSYREVADTLDISIGTVMSRLFYARQKLKTLLADQVQAMMPDNLTPDDLPHDLLAGYADGELEPADRDAVREWLARDPAARAELAAQREFGPGNAPLWERAEPPEPSSAAWLAVRRGIEDRLNPAAPRAGSTGRFRTAAWVVGALAASAVAASVAWVALVPGAKLPPVEGGTATREVARAGPERAPAPRAVAARSDDPIAEYAVLPVASDEEVSLERVPDTRAGWLPIGRHPLPEELALASADEVHWPAFDLTPVWPTGRPKVPTTPDHEPIIFAAKPR